MVSLFLILKIENWISSAKKARFSAFSRRSDLVFMYTPTHISKVDYDSWRYKRKFLSGENFPFWNDNQNGVHYIRRWKNSIPKFLAKLRMF